MVVARTDKPIFIPKPIPPKPPKLEEVGKEIGKKLGDIAKKTKFEADAADIGGAIAKAKLGLGATEIGKKIGEGIKDLAKDAGDIGSKLWDKIKDGKIDWKLPGDCKCCHIHHKPGAQTLAAGIEQGGGKPFPGGGNTGFAIENGGGRPSNPIQTLAAGTEQGGGKPIPLPDIIKPTPLPSQVIDSIKDIGSKIF